MAIRLWLALLVRKSGSVHETRNYQSTRISQYTRMQPNKIFFLSQRPNNVSFHIPFREMRLTYRFSACIRCIAMQLLKCRPVKRT
jgi:hypothetical protein